MKKEDFNPLYMIVLMVLGFIFFVFRYKSITFGYIGLGLISAGFVIGFFEAIRSNLK